MQSAIRPVYPVGIFQSLAKQSPNGAVDLHHRVQLPNLLPGAELIDILLQMFRTHLVVDTVIAPFQAAPERFCTVDVRLDP